MDFRKLVPDGYFPKLDSNVVGRSWPSRPDNVYLSDVDRKSENLRISIADIERYRDRILEAIHTRTIINTDGSLSPLTDYEGIDVLGNMIESSTLSPNSSYYGDMHNFAHVLIAFCHDPDNKHLVSIDACYHNYSDS